MDDTILVYSAVADPIWRGLCVEYAQSLPFLSPERLFNVIQEVARWFWSDRERHKKGRLALQEARREIVRRAFERLGVNEPDRAKELADRFTEERDLAVYPFEKALETLELLSGQGVRLALVTNGEGIRQRNKITRFQLERFFDTVLIEGERGFGKPEEKVYRQALIELDLKAEEVWAVGDHLEWDVAGPKGLGIFGVWHDHEKRGLPPDTRIVPDRIVHRIHELEAFFFGDQSTDGPKANLDRHSK